MKFRIIENQTSRSVTVEEIEDGIILGTRYWGPMGVNRKSEKGNLTFSNKSFGYPSGSRVVNPESVNLSISSFLHVVEMTNCQSVFYPDHTILLLIGDVPLKGDISYLKGVYWRNGVQVTLAIANGDYSIE